MGGLITGTTARPYSGGSAVNQTVRGVGNRCGGGGCGDQLMARCHGSDDCCRARRRKS